jgi:hypothetical protein
MSNVIDFYKPEQIVKSITVNLSNVGGVYIDAPFERSAEELKIAMDMMLEAVFILREELGQCRLKKVLEEQNART